MLIQRAFIGIRNAEQGAGLPALSVGAAAALYLGALVAANVTGRLTSTLPTLMFDIVALAAGAGAVYLVQRHATALQQTAHPELDNAGAQWTWGMILALAIGLLAESFILLIILLAG